MGIRLGNIQFNQVEDKLGYKLTPEDKKVWDEYHNEYASLEGMESSFHVFDMPRCIVFKGKGAKRAIIKMFTKDKITRQLGRFGVMEQK